MIDLALSLTCFGLFLAGMVALAMFGDRIMGDRVEHGDPWED